MKTERESNQQSMLTSQPSQLNNNHQAANDIEGLLDRVGGQHRYQFISFIIFCGIWFLTGLTLTGQSFFFDDNYECYDLTTKKQCQKYICDLPSQERKDAIKSHSSSIIFAFDEYFICENSYYMTIFQSLVYGGSLIGFFIIPYIADNWGRRIAIMLSWAIYGGGILCLSLAQNGTTIAVGQFLSGFGCNPAVTLCYSFLNQQCLGKRRQIYSVAIQLALAVGQCLIAILFLPDWSWRDIFYLMLALNVLIFICLFYLVESPKFLCTRSLEKTLQALNSIGRKNKKQPLVLEDLKELKLDEQDTSYSTIDLCRYGSLRAIAFGTGIGFMAIQIIYYVTLLNLDNLGFSKLINQQILGISQFIGYLAIELIIVSALRKLTSIIGLGISSLLCLILTVLAIFKNDGNQQVIKWVETAILLLDRFILCAFWALFYVYITELYPTKVRSLGLGLASALGTVGSVCAPIIIDLCKNMGINSWIPPGVIGLLSTLTLFCLKQTKNQQLYDQIEEVRNKISTDSD